MKSLKDLIELELAHLALPKEFSRLSDFINDGKKSADFIRYLLRGNTYDIPDKKTSLYNVAEMRARHSAVTFLMGLVFRDFGAIFENIPLIIDIDKNSMYAQRMWLITSLYHDIAYSSTYISAAHLNYHDKFSPYLLTDDPQNLPLPHNFSDCYPGTLAYTYDEILNYSRYAKEFHARRGDTERCDHGILGGLMMFSELSNKAKRQGLPEEALVIKACSLAVAQHNIFKSPSYNSDSKYRDYQLYNLLSTSPFRITQDKTLLLFLSLIDTIECVKKFSQKENPEKYLETLSVLKSINIAVSPDSIELDYSLLQKEIQKKQSKQLTQTFLDYERLLDCLHTWTIFEATKSKDDECRYTITLPREYSSFFRNSSYASTGLY